MFSEKLSFIRDVIISTLQLLFTALITSKNIELTFCTSKKSFVRPEIKEF